MTDTAAETIAPTSERLRHAAYAEAPVIDQKRERRAWRMCTLAQGLHTDGKISDGCLRAAETFERDWLLANAHPSGVGGYGQRIPGSDDSGEHLEIRKLNAQRRVERALAAVASPHAKRAIVMSVSAKEGCATGYTLADIGRECSGLTNRATATAAGTVTLRDALYQLHLYYEPG